MKFKELCMMSEGEKRLDFKDRVSPYLEVLLQFSLWLTKNGRDAAQLMREAMAEAYRSWDVLMPDECCKMWLHKILSRRFFDGFHQHMRPLVPKSWLSGESD
jgi:DNA-directed RNA polymerase specialized sigma24 family protein